jgi:hypothetical protein
LLRILPDAANADGEFAIAARMWDAQVVFASERDAVRFDVRDGRVKSASEVSVDSAAPVRVRGSADGWAKLLQASPPPFYQDLFGAAVHHGFTIEGDVETVYPYYAALRRLIELAREG